MNFLMNRKKCSGCGVCKNVCTENSIEIVFDEEGFYYPQIDNKKCINCKKCRKTCPVLGSEKKCEKEKPSALAAYNKNENIRLNSSSGGIFTLIAEVILKDKGIIFGAVFDKDFNVIHKGIENSEDLQAFRGSKYLQSKIGNTYKEAEDFLKQGKKVLFTGTPCQIAGLKSYLKKDYQNLYCQDIICHGVPSPKVWQKYLEYQKEKHTGAPQRIAFRNKQSGWKRFSVSIIFDNDTEYRKTLDKDPMMQVFLRNLCLRPSCYQCSFKTLSREADITLADFWGIENVLPEIDDDKGTSLVLVHSDKGKELIKKIKDQMICKEVDVDEAIQNNSAAIRSVNENPKREAFFKDLEKDSFDLLMKKYCTDSTLLKAKRIVRGVLSKIKRKIIG